MNNKINGKNILQKRSSGIKVNKDVPDVIFKGTKYAKTLLVENDIYAVLIFSYSLIAKSYFIMTL